MIVGLPFMLGRMAEPGLHRSNVIGRHPKHSRDARVVRTLAQALRQFPVREAQGARQDRASLRCHPDAARFRRQASGGGFNHMAVDRHGLGHRRPKQVTNVNAALQDVISETPIQAFRESRHCRLRQRRLRAILSELRNYEQENHRFDGRQVSSH